MAHVELTKVEERHGGRLPYTIRVTGNDCRTELPVTIKDEGTTTSNETAALRSALKVVEEMAASIKLCLGTAYP